jgi:hypothetical protein
MDDENNIGPTRGEIDQKNRDRLVGLCNRHGLFIPQRDFDKWRPTVETTGEVDGFWHLGQLRCIATDGLQAWFLRVDGQPWIGHVGNFHWDEKVVSYVPYINEFGERRFFKSVKDRGAPSAFFGMPKVYRPRVAAGVERKKQRLSAQDRAAKLLEKLTKGTK